MTTSPPPTSVPDRFDAFVVTRSDEKIDTGLRSLSVEDLAPGEVVIRVDWSAINFKDAMAIQPGNRVGRISPLIPGIDLVGTVLESTDPTLEVGDQVIGHGNELGTAHHGGFSQVARVPRGWMVPLPDGLTARQAATIGTAGFTAALSLERLELLGLTPDAGPILVTGASGGVGSMAVSLLAGRGYEVVASTGKADEHGYLKQLGASQVVGRAELQVAGGRTLGPERWAGAVDCVGGATLADVVRTLRYGAAVAASGLTGGVMVETSVFPFIVRGVSIIGVDTSATPVEERKRLWRSMASAWPDHLLSDMVDRVVRLEELEPHLGRIMAGGARGRTLVTPNG